MFLVNKDNVEGCDQPRDQKQLVGGGMLGNVSCDVIERRHSGDEGEGGMRRDSRLLAHSNIVRLVLCGEAQLLWDKSPLGFALPKCGCVLIPRNYRTSTIVTVTVTVNDYSIRRRVNRQT